VRRCWAPAPWRPRVARQQVRKFVHALAAVSPFDGAVASLLCRELDAIVMSVFLAHVQQRFPGDFCIVVLDGAGWHIAGDLVVPDTTRLVLLPPNSPELDPVECLWDYLRDHDTGNRSFPTVDHVEATLCTAFRDLAQAPTVVRSITLFDWVNRASLMVR
jgi:transposase